MQSYFHFVSLANALLAFTAVYLAVRPRLLGLGFRRHLMVLTGIHLFRYIGLTLYLPNLFDWAALSVPDRLAFQLGYWDFLNGLLALVAFTALRLRWRLAIPFTWLFVVVAMADQTISGSEIMSYLTDARQIGPMPWLLVAVYLPALVVSSVAILVLLVSQPSLPASHSLASQRE